MFDAAFRTAQARRRPRHGKAGRDRPGLADAGDVTSQVPFVFPPRWTPFVVKLNPS
jgi:hypothetical protein